MGDGVDKSEGEKPESAKAQANEQGGDPSAAPDATPTAQAAPAESVGDVPAVEAKQEAKEEAKNAAIPDDLPVVEAPKLDGSDAIEPAAASADAPAAEPTDFETPEFDEGASIGPSDVEAGDSTIPEVAAEMSEPPPAPAPQQRSSRFALLAAVIALAAAVGAAFGSLTATGFMKLMPAQSAAAAATLSSTEMHDMLRTMREQLAELSALKNTLDVATRGANAQFAKNADRLDRVERAETDQAAKLAHIADAVDKLDRHAAALDATGSITSADPTIEGKATDRILQDWVVQQVQGGRALVENRNGGIFEIGAGSVLPGVGRVDAVKRQDGQWVVVTARGLILSAR